MAEKGYCQDLSAGKEQTQPESQAVWLLVQQAPGFGGDFGVSGCWPFGFHLVLYQGSELHMGF